MAPKAHSQRERERDTQERERETVQRGILSEKAEKASLIC